MSKSLRNWIIVLAIGFVIWVCPTPQGLTPNAWHLFAVFAATIAGFILQPISMGAVAFIALTFCAITGVLKTGQALMGFGNGTIWLIVCAFFLSRAFIKTGFGRRIAFLIIKYIGRSSLTLGYSIALSELIVSPAMPSATARGGGVFYPIVQSLANAFGSQPGPTAGKIGKYLMQVGYHTDAVTCTMFLTSMAGNPLCVGLAATAVGVEITWMNWAVAAIVPGLISLFLVPVLMLKLSPPEIRDIPDARDLAVNELEKMGPMSLQEKVLAFVFVMCLALWATGSWTKLGATPVAMLAVAIMLIAKVLDWKDILSEKALGTQCSGWAAWLPWLPRWLSPALLLGSPNLSVPQLLPLIWAGLHPSSLSPSFISILTIASLRLQPVFLRCTQHSWQLPPPAVFRLCWLPSHSAASLTCRFR